MLTKSPSLVTTHTPKSRQSIMLLLLTVLVVLNAWHWWPDTQIYATGNKTVMTDFIPENEVRINDYSTPTPKDSMFTRDLFLPVVKQDKTPKIELKKAIKKDTPSVKSEKPASGLATLRLEGILDADGKIQAFLSQKDQVYMVYAGDKFATSYIAERINHEGILVKNISDGGQKWIMLGEE